MKSNEMISEDMPVPALTSASLETQINGFSRDSKQQFKYVLAEFEATQAVYCLRIQRFEQLITFYLTGTTAIGSAVVLVATSKVSYPPIPALMGLLLIVLSVFGSTIFVRMCTIRHAMAQSRARLAIHREYFARRFPGILSFVTPYSFESAYTSWRQGTFNTQVTVLLILMSLANSLSLALGVGLVLSQLHGLLGLQVDWPILVALTLGALLAAVVASGLYLRGRIRSAETEVHCILDSVKVGPYPDNAQPAANARVP